eukprot:evm.model.scf_1626.1 EVM.evm.TU.scf_1626.1   scf_1626:10753-13554(+)
MASFGGSDDGLAASVGLEADLASAKGVPSNAKLDIDSARGDMDTEVRSLRRDATQAEVELAFIKSRPDSHGPGKPRGHTVEGVSKECTGLQHQIPTLKNAHAELIRRNGRQRCVLATSSGAGMPKQLRRTDGAARQLTVPGMGRNLGGIDADTKEGKEAIDTQVGKMRASNALFCLFGDEGKNIGKADVHDGSQSAWEETTECLRQGSKRVEDCRSTHAAQQNGAIPKVMPWQRRRKAVVVTAWACTTFSRVAQAADGVLMLSSVATTWMITIANIFIMLTRIFLRMLNGGLVMKSKSRETQRKVYVTLILMIIFASVMSMWAAVETIMKFDDRRFRSGLREKGNCYILEDLSSPYHPDTVGALNVLDGAGELVVGLLKLTMAVATGEKIQAYGDLLYWRRSYPTIIALGFMAPALLGLWYEASKGDSSVSCGIGSHRETLGVSSIFAEYVLAGGRTVLPNAFGLQDLYDVEMMQYNEWRKEVVENLEEKPPGGCYVPFGLVGVAEEYTNRGAVRLQIRNLEQTGPFINETTMEIECVINTMLNVYTQEIGRDDFYNPRLEFDGFSLNAFNLAQLALLLMTAVDLGLVAYNIVFLSCGRDRTGNVFLCQRLDDDRCGGGICCIIWLLWIIVAGIGVATTIQAKNQSRFEDWNLEISDVLIGNVFRVDRLKVAVQLTFMFAVDVMALVGTLTPRGDFFGRHLQESAVQLAGE